MTSHAEHEAIQEILAAYALDAVDGDEAEMVELHLRDCPRCRAEVAEHREAASMLATGHGPAPVHVWDNIVATLDEVPPAEAARILPMSPQGGWPRSARIAVLSAAALFAALVGLRVVEQGNELDRMQAALRDRTVLAAATAAQADPDARRTELRSATGVVLAHAVLGPDGTGYVWSEGLPRLSADRTYQLWAVVGTERISAGVLGAEPDLAPFRIAGDVLGLAITEEIAGGVVASQNSPVVTGLIRNA